MNRKRKGKRGKKENTSFSEKEIISKDKDNHI